MKKLLWGFLMLLMFACEKEPDTTIIQQINQESILMDYYAALGASTASMNWQLEVAKNVSKNYQKYALGGTRWSHTSLSTLDLSANASENPNNKVMANQLARLLRDKRENGYNPNLITIMCGLNDAASGTGIIGNYEETMALNMATITIEDWFTNIQYKKLRETVYGSTRFVVEQLIRHFPKSQIIIMTPQQVNNGTYNYQNTVAVNTALEKIANRYSVVVIDVFKESGITDAGGLINQYLLADGLHPNADGEKLLTNFLTQRLRYLYFKKGTLPHIPVSSN